MNSLIIFYKLLIYWTQYPNDTILQSMWNYRIFNFHAYNNFLNACLMWILVLKSPSPPHEKKSRMRHYYETSFGEWTERSLVWCFYVAGIFSGLIVQNNVSQSVYHSTLLYRDHNKDTSPMILHFFFSRWIFLRLEYSYRECIKTI